MRLQSVVLLLVSIVFTISLGSCKKEGATFPSFRILINGIPQSLDDTPPIIKDELQMIPVQRIMEELGYSCLEDITTKSITCTKGTQEVKIRENSLDISLDGIPYELLEVSPFTHEGLLYVEAQFLKHVPTSDAAWDEESQSLQIYDYDQLDTGLYFFDGEPNEWGEWDAPGSQKLVLGEENPFYDPNKPTLIWIHGWQNGGVSSKSRPSFRLESDGIDKYTHQIWIDKGWNVAIFHWLQLADETLPFDAESKINAASNNSVEMRWKKADGDFSDLPSPSIPVAEIFAKAYEELSTVQNHPTIRLAGSSFGGQVALHGTERILNNGIAELPSRLALLDIAWTPNFVEDQQLNTNEITARAASNLSPFIPIEYYRSSALTTTLTPDGLISNSAFQEMVFDYAGLFGIELKHTIVTHHYLWSYEFPPNLAKDENDNLVGLGLSASTASTTIQQMMGEDFHWLHSTGKSTYTPSDDGYTRKNGAGF